jgi:hypothetical protein
LETEYEIAKRKGKATKKVLNSHRTTEYKVKVKLPLHLINHYAKKAGKDAEVQLSTFLSSVLDGCKQLPSHCSCSTPR